MYSSRANLGERRYSFITEWRNKACYLSAGFYEEKKIRPSMKAWYNDDCQIPRNFKQAAYYRGSRLKTPEKREEYIVARAACDGACRDAEKKYIAFAKRKLFMSSDPHTWWSTLKSVAIRERPSLPFLLSFYNGELILSKKKRQS